MSAYKDFLDTYASDNKITGHDVRAFGDAGGSQEDIEKFLAKAQEGAKGFEGTVGDKALTAASKEKNFGASGGSSDFGGGEITNNYEDDGTAYLTQFYGDLGPGMTPAMFDQLGAESLEKIKGEQNVNYANAVGANNILVQQLISDSNDYAAQLGLQGTQYAADRNLDIAQYTADSDERWRKYLADVGKESAAEVQGLKNQGAVDLQAIVNTGLTDVADIQGAYASERVELQGTYDVQRSNIQSDFEKFKAARAKEGQIYGSLMAGFWS